jgi:hypothetical protein
MENWVNLLLNSDYGLPTVGPESTVFIMVFSFAVGHFIGFIYMWTHEAISYSRTFVAALVVLPLIVGIIMLTMTGSLLVAFGLFAVFGVIRFRNVLKDTRDTSYILWAVGEGLAIGTMRYSTALLGSLGVAAALFYLRLTSFGTRHRYDAVLTLRLTGDLAGGLTRLKQIMRQHSTRADIANERRLSDEGLDLSYRVLLRDPSRSDELEMALKQSEGIERIALFMHDDEAEI